ncbi:MAG: tryptophan 2,3-dioxygenase family protein [Luteibaculaceae bacterium]
MSLTNDIIARVKELEEKYKETGQDYKSYLEGLLYADYLSYWDYIHLDTLLSLQSPKTPFPDEEIFIMYHQITELYFKLSLHEINQLCVTNVQHDKAFFTERVRRINRYFQALTFSFDIMVQGMDKEQFLKFRMALLPASGFQSAQYRMIEIACTPLENLVQNEIRNSAKTDNLSLEELMDKIYWKQGATELATGEKTYTLIQFEKKYGKKLTEWAHTMQHKNIWMVYQNLSKQDQECPKLINELKALDIQINVNWPLCHYKSAVQYLQKSEAHIAATGGTNWQKYLPPKIQKRIFFKSLYSTQELEAWGKGFVDIDTEYLGKKAV